MEKAEHIIRKLTSLPTLPLVVDNLTQVVNNPQSCSKDLSEIITKDPSLSARVLKIVNSSFYGFSQKIPTVSRAVVILGYSCVKNLALSSTIFNFLAEKVDSNASMERVFSVSVNNKEVLHQLSGKGQLVPEKAISFKATVEAKDGKGIAVSFTDIKGEAILNGIQLLKIR